VLENPTLISSYLEKVYGPHLDTARLQAGAKTGDLNIESESRRIIFATNDTWKNLLGTCTRMANGTC